MSPAVGKSDPNRRCRDDQYGPCMEFVNNGPYRLRHPLTRPAEGGHPLYVPERGGHTIESALRAAGMYVPLVKKFGRERPTNRQRRSQ
jgi:hypothetical protein